MTQAHLVLITAGLAEPSATALLGESLGKAAARALEAGGISPEVTHIPLRSLAKEITNHYLTGFPTGELAEALDAVREADALIVVTPVFKASYSGLFKSFWDLVEDGTLAGKPVLLGATGGTARHSLVIDTALRPLFSYLKATVVPSGVFAATDDFGADSSLEGRINRAAGEFAQLLTWTLGATGPLPATPDPEPTKEATPEVGSTGEGTGLAEVNAGSFFGLAVKETSQSHKAPGLEALTVTPFEELLKRNEAH